MGSPVCFAVGWCKMLEDVLLEISRLTSLGWVGLGELKARASSVGHQNKFGGHQNRFGGRGVRCEMVQVSNRLCEAHSASRMNYDS